MYVFLLNYVPLPIPPSSLEIKTPSMNKTRILINEGEINIPKSKGLREISFEFLLPAVNCYPFSLYNLGLPGLGNYTASVLIPLLNWWREQNEPTRFIVARLAPDFKPIYFTNILCLIEDFTYKEDAEELGFDTMCSITLKEYKPYATKRIKVEKSSDGKPGSKTAKVTNTRDASSKVKSSTVTPQKGETVVSAAKKNGDDLVDLSKHNNIQITSADSMSTVSKGLDIDQSIDLSKYAQPTFEGIDSAGNVVIGGVKSPQVQSMGDTILLGSPPVKTYQSPSATQTQTPNIGMSGTHM